MQPSVSINGETKFVCVKCLEAKPMKERIHLRDGAKTCCTHCADTEGLEYTKAKKGAPCQLVVYDEWVDVKQIVKDVDSGRIDKKKLKWTKFKKEA